MRKGTHYVRSGHLRPFQDILRNFQKLNSYKLQEETVVQKLYHEIHACYLALGLPLPLHEGAIERTNTAIGQNLHGIISRARDTTTSWSVLYSCLVAEINRSITGRISRCARNDSEGTFYLFIVRVIIIKIQSIFLGKTTI